MRIGNGRLMFRIINTLSENEMGLRWQSFVNVTGAQNVIRGRQNGGRRIDE